MKALLTLDRPDYGSQPRGNLHPIRRLNLLRVCRQSAQVVSQTGHGGEATLLRMLHQDRTDYRLESESPARADEIVTRYVMSACSNAPRTRQAWTASSPSTAY